MLTQRSWLCAALALTIVALTSCNVPGPSPSNENAPLIMPRTPAVPPAATQPRLQTETTSVPYAEPSTPVIPPDLTHRPLYWFAPLPPMPIREGRHYIGSDDFMQLFVSDAQWTQAASNLQVFKLYGEWVSGTATDAELQQVVQDLRRRGLALAVEAGPLEAPANCGQGVEGFAGTAEGRHIAERIKAAGGVIDVLAMDEPFFFAHIYDGPNACHWTPEQVAQGVQKYIQVMRGEFPSLIVGDIEPLAGAATAADYKGWMDTFRNVNGYNLPFLHMDCDWGRSTWPEEVKAIEDYGRSIGVPVGIIYFGNYDDTTDEAWLTHAGEHVKRYELQTGGQPDHVIFQSWHDKPDHVLPESAPYTFTSFIDGYFTDKSALGVRTSGAGANLAYNKSVTASSTESGHAAQAAVDGDTGTWWSAGAPPTQWIRIDLGAPYDIQEIRLIPSQYPAGQTTHNVIEQDAATNNQPVVLHSFSGSTADGQVLSYKPEQPWHGVQVIMVQTVASPSWVAWREIEVIAAGP